MSPLCACAPLLPRTPALARMLAHRMALIRALAGGRVGIVRVRRAGGPSDSKFVLQTQRSPSSGPTSPLCPGASPGLVRHHGHLGQRTPRCEILRFRAWPVGPGDKSSGWGACPSSWRERVAGGGSRWPACPDLWLGRSVPDPRGSRDPEVGRGQTFPTEVTCALSRDQAGASSRASRLSQRMCPGARRWREMRRPNSAPLRGGAHTLQQAQHHLFSPLTFLLRSPGRLLSSFAPAVALVGRQLLTPRQ